jgi:hypothetical protein
MHTSRAVVALQGMTLEQHVCVCAPGDCVRLHTSIMLAIVPQLTRSVAHTYYYGTPASLM